MSAATRNAAATAAATAPSQAALTSNSGATTASNSSSSSMMTSNAQPAATNASSGPNSGTVATAARPPTSLLFSRGNLVSSRMGGAGGTAATARPSTAVRAVGYAANNGSAGQRFDQFFLEKAKQQTLSSANAAVDVTKEVNPQVKYKNLETKIVKLLEASIVLAAHHSRNAKLTNTGGGGGGGSVGGGEISNNGANNTLSAEVKAGFAEALNKAKEAFSLDRTLHRFRDQHGENIFHNFDLTYAVFFNLAEQYEHNEMHIDALNTYSIMTKNKMFPHVNQLKLNMGNIYYRMGIYTKAIKMYRMALDSVPNNLKQLRLKITQNIGTLFVRMGQYADAASSFEFVMSERADIISGIHLILCYYAMGDVEKIKSTFRNLCDVQPVDIDNDVENENQIIKLQQQQQQQDADDMDAEDAHMRRRQSSTLMDSGGGAGGIVTTSTEDEEDFRVEPNVSNGMQATATASNQHNKNSSASTSNGGAGGAGGGGNSGGSNGNGAGGRRNTQRYVQQALKSDELALFFKQKRNNEKRAITMIVDLISPLIEENYNDGYNWCVEVIKASNLAWLVNELELNKALVYLRQNDVQQAIETLQMYDRKSEGSMTASALTNLTFIYINLSNLDMAAHCVQQLQDIGAMQSNAMALVNASIVDYRKQKYAAAKSKLERALEIQPDSFEANYNLGLVAMQQNDYELAEEQFELLKTQLMVPHSVQHSHVYYQLAKLQEKRHSAAIGGGAFKLHTTPAALQLYLQVLGISASETDSRLYEKVGSIYEQLQDHQEANQYYNEAYRINPSDIDIGSSIGSYYIKLQATEKAIYYYERAVLANPTDPNLMLRVASCFRHSYMPPKQYLGMFERIYIRFPDNLNCVRALIQVTKSLGMTEQHEKYTQEYNRLQKQQQDRQHEQRMQQQRLSSGRGSSRLRSLRANNNDANELSTPTKRTVAESNNGNGIYDRNIMSGNIITSNFDGERYVRETEAAAAATFADPLGPPPERPRTGMLRGVPSNDSDDDDINTDSLLPI